MVTIQKKLTPYNFTAMSNKKIQYIVVHYVGAVSTDKNNADNLYNHDYRGTIHERSAHYFVDENSIWQSVEDKDRAWHCGGGLQGKYGHTFFGKCTNYNSIGIEMCCKKTLLGKWYFEPKTVENTVALVKMLMEKHNIPIENVIRHYDVTGKDCPAPYIDEIKWQEFKNMITSEGLTMSQYEELKKEIDTLKAENKALKDVIGAVYKTADEIPDYYKSTVQPMIDKGVIKGVGNNNLNLPEILVRGLVYYIRDKNA